VFWFELISSAAPELEVEKDETSTRDKVPLHVGAPVHTLLYVEDNEANMKLVEQIIARRPDIRLLTAVNGLLGIELARKAQPNAQDWLQGSGICIQPALPETGNGSAAVTIGAFTFRNFVLVP
jgi:hypothetical protein